MSTVEKRRRTLRRLGVNIHTCPGCGASFRLKRTDTHFYIREANRDDYIFSEPCCTDVCAKDTIESLEVDGRKYEVCYSTRFTGRA